MINLMRVPNRARSLLDRALSPLSRKAFYFDLDTKALRGELGKSDTRVAYSIIRKTFEELGVEHRQYSGYLSQKQMSGARAFGVLDELSMRLP